MIEAHRAPLEMIMKAMMTLSKERAVPSTRAVTRAWARRRRGLVGERQYLSQRRERAGDTRVRGYSSSSTREAHTHTARPDCLPTGFDALLAYSE